MDFSRRDLLKKGLGLAVIAPVSAVAFQAFAQAAKQATKTTPAAKAPAAAKGPKLTLVDPTKDPVAKALGYVHDSSQAPATVRVTKTIMGKTYKGSDQLCNNCALYTAQGVDDSGKEAGKCTMIAGGSVKSGGWCKSWSPKTT